MPNAHGLSRLSNVAGITSRHRLRKQAAETPPDNSSNSGDDPMGCTEHPAVSVMDLVAPPAAAAAPQQTPASMTSAIRVFIAVVEHSGCCPRA
mmetsp:Transcript_75862/g.148621  ORF Transcript_75862/g.148621 Transcript_75862/m.148621 type:complete len:93 (+) Transcript_75862:243-521(+)